MVSKKKNRRSSQKYPTLTPGYDLKRRAENLECDYVDKLSEENKEWLNKFNEEYVNASLDPKNKSNNLHKTKALVKDCYDRNNARNRDILTRVKASGEDYTLGTAESYTVEDDIIEMIDKKKKK